MGYLKFSFHRILIFFAVLIGTSACSGSLSDSPNVILNSGDSGLKTSFTAGMLTLHDFNPTPYGSNPNGTPLLLGSTLYGMAVSGGASNHGTIFSIPVTGGVQTTLYSFTGTGTDGATPNADLIASNDGTTLYGMTLAGGTSNLGTIFSIPVTGGTPTTLYSFTGVGTDGSQPYGSLTLSVDGSTLYGMTSAGGSNGFGMIFSIPATGGALTTLYSFAGSASWANGNLLLKGTTLYGMTVGGGASASGSIFSIPVTGGVPTVLHDFTGVGTDGSYPYGSFIISADGNTLYGTACCGGASNKGIVFSVPIGGGVPTTLYSFTGVGADGAYPQSNLILSGGNLYGMTEAGGTAGLGVIFSVPVGGGAATILHSFTGVGSDGSSGGYGYGSLILSGDASTFYGLTYAGGDYSLGTLFSTPVAGGAVTTLSSFNTHAADGLNPNSNLTLVGNTLYGGTEAGGLYGNGLIFSIPVTGGTPTPLYNFTGGADGKYPIGTMVSVGDKLYGMTVQGGTSNLGVIFSIPLIGGAPTVLYSFTGIGTDGSSTFTGLTLSESGDTLYGTTSAGGTGGMGIIFSIPVAGGVPTTIHSFMGGAADGGNYPSSVVVSNGILYGTTANGGTSNDGIIYSIPVTGGAISVLYSFTQSAGAGEVLVSGDNLYGVTSQDGASSVGTVYSIPKAGGAMTLLHTFTCGGPDGCGGGSNIVLNGSTLYGATYNGGADSFGTLYSIPLSGGDLTTLYSFTNGADGAYAFGGVTFFEGTLFGTTRGGSGGPADAGAIFQFGL